MHIYDSGIALLSHSYGGTQEKYERFSRFPFAASNFLIRDDWERVRFQTSPNKTCRVCDQCVTIGSKDWAAGSCDDPSTLSGHPTDD